MSFPITNQRKVFIEKVQNVIKNNVLKNDDKDKSIFKIYFIKGEKLFDGLNINLEYVSSGATGHIFKAKFNHYLDKEYKKEKYLAIKFVPYTNEYEDIHDKNRPENIDFRICFALSEYVKGNTCPHFIIPIFRCLIDIEYLIKRLLLEKKKKKLSKDHPIVEFLKRYSKHELTKYVSTLIYEWCDSGNLYSYMKNNFSKFGILDYKNLFFQVIYGVGQIQWHNPQFRHNDLKPDNILVQSYDLPDEKEYWFKYKCADETEFLLPCLPNSRVQIMIWDFDFTAIDKKIENYKVKEEWNDKYGVNLKQNRYYDIHFFFTILFSQGFFASKINNNDLPKEVIEFYKRIVPSKYRYINGETNKNLSCDDSARLIVDDEYTTPLDILTKDPFFKEFIHEKKAD